MSDPADTPEVEPAPPPADPRPFQLRGDPPRVMRLSRKALAVVGVAAGLGIGGSLIYALRPAGPHEAKELYNTDSRAGDAITSGPRDYAQAPRLGPPLPGDLGRPIVAAQERGAAVPAPPSGGQTAPSDPRAQAAEAARQRAAQERDAARTSAVFLGGGTAATAAPAQLAGSAASLAPTTAATTTATAQGDQASKRAFLAQASNQQTVSVERLTAPASPNIVQAGSIIPAALINGIRSDLPGQITAQVTQNVYDSPTGRILLIPQGARLVGEYDSQITAGQARVLLAWDRLILPDGRSIALERQPGADAAGYAGLQDRVDEHWGNMLKAAAISTLLGVGAEMATNNNDPLVQALRYGTQDTINQTGQQIVRRQLDVPPTLTIRAGYPLRVVVTRDLVLDPVGAAR